MKFERTWKCIQPYSLLGYWKSRKLFSLLKEVLARGVPGDLADCGVFYGGSALMMARVIAKKGEARKVFLFDSFQGLPAPDPVFDRYYTEGAMAAPGLFRKVKKAFRSHGLLPWAVFRKGWFHETMPLLPPSQRFALVHVDCDLYRAAKTCLDELYERVPAGGVLVFDDYFDIGGGVRNAVNTFLRRHGELLFLGMPSQAYIIKGRKPKAKDKPFLLHAGARNAVAVSIEGLTETELAALRFQRERPPVLPGAIHTDLSTLQYHLSLMAPMREVVRFWESLYAKLGA